MIFTEMALAGAFIIELEKLGDHRGFFARTWCHDEFEEHGLASALVQCNVSYNFQKGTLRGMHYQAAPHEEAKLVRCTHGAVYDVIVDLRPDSVTYQQWRAVELTADNYRMVYVPKGFAHGFQTLEEHTEVFYQMSEFYHPECVRGARWNDPTFKIEWPLLDPILSANDQGHPDFSSSLEGGAR